MIDEGGVRQLHTFRTRVTFGDRVLVEELAPHIAGLRVLSIGQSQVSSPGALAIAESTAFAALHHLSLHSNRIDDRGALELVDSPHLASLRYLNLYDNHISAAALERIRARPEWQDIRLVLHRQSA